MDKEAVVPGFPSAWAGQALSVKWRRSLCWCTVALHMPLECELGPWWFFPQECLTWKHLHMIQIGRQENHSPLGEFPHHNSLLSEINTEHDTSPHCQLQVDSGQGTKASQSLGHQLGLRNVPVPRTHSVQNWRSFFIQPRHRIEYPD